MFDEIIKALADALTVATTLRPPPTAPARTTSRFTESERILEARPRVPLGPAQIRSNPAGCIPAIVPSRVARWRIWKLPNRAAARPARQ